MRKANIVCACAGMLFSVIAFVMTLSFRQFQNVPVGPEFFPRYLAAGLFICCLVLFLQQFRYRDARPAPVISPRDKGIQRLLKGGAIVLVYALLWEVLGFIIVTPLAVFALMFLLGMRKYPVMIIFSLAAMLVVFSAFRFLLGVDMPLGFFDGLL
ncbi:MAG: tripartite tricarboxylate transporter TctB family protein [Spirochaetaceae bacterium]|nr:tripartite tricarboxylate transporter TctB family protein [Spirochaetaceae bacterium]